MKKLEIYVNSFFDSVIIESSNDDVNVGQYVVIESDKGNFVGQVLRVDSEKNLNTDRLSDPASPARRRRAKVASGCIGYIFCMMLFFIFGAGSQLNKCSRLHSLENQVNLPD